MQGLAVYSPDDALRTMWRLFPRFTGFRQQDAHEFLSAVLGRLEDEWTPPSGKSQTKPKPKGKAKPKPPAGPAKLFWSSSVTTVECQECGHQSVSKQPFVGCTTVQIPVKFHSAARSSSRSRRGPECQLQACLEETFQTEELSGSSAYQCDSCDRKVTAVKTASFGPPPPVLVLHIMRTDWRFGSQKLATNVTFPLEGLDLAKYVTAGDDSGEVGTTYSLSALVEHQGRGIGEGHYGVFYVCAGVRVCVCVCVRVANNQPPCRCCSRVREKPRT